MAALIALALLAKLLVPIGWMPTFDARGVHLELCGSYGPPPPALAHTMMMHAKRPMQGHDHHKGHDKKGGDQNCAYAGLSLAGTDTSAPAFPDAERPADATPPPKLVSEVGRGLAAPPPPSTGPPAFA